MSGISNNWPMPEVTRASVETATGPVGYLVVGDGPPILYFHGTGAGNELAAVMERDLLAAGCRLIIPNRPGYGDTPLACRRSSPDAARLGCSVLDALGVERVIVIGTSGGGLPALHFAAMFPQRATGLMLQCAQSHRWDSSAWLPAGKGWILRLALQPTLKRLIHYAHHMQTRRLRWMRTAYLRAMSGTRFPEILASPEALELRDAMIEHSIRCVKQPAGIENDLDVLLYEPLLLENLVQCPTLIIHDRCDPVVPFQHAEWSLSMIPHAELLGVHAAGHLIWIGRDAALMSESRLAFIRRHLDGC